MKHKLYLKSTKYIPVDSELIPLGRLDSVFDTPMDFTNSKVIGNEIDTDFEQLNFTGGYDHSFLIDKNVEGIEKIAVLTGDISNISMEVYSDCLGVQFYAGNFIDDVPQFGKNNCKYIKRSGICLETGFLPDAVNQKNFTSPILKRNKIYNTKTIYKFI